MQSNNRHFKIKDLAEADRPREKMLQKGCSALTNSELLGILIGSGVENLTAIDVAQNVLSNYHDNLNELGKANINELTKIKGIGPARAVNIMAALELGKRRNLSKALERPTISSSVDAVKILSPYIADLSREEFWVIFLNKSHTVIDIRQMSKGGLDRVVVDVRVILKQALDLSATALIVAHNHPSGSTTPSQQDCNITKQIKGACDALMISFLDHIIITSQQDNFYSFKDNGHF